MFELISSPISGCFEILPKASTDARGSFFKVFHGGFFQTHEIAFSPREAYCSWSKPGVIRGMHFQIPPKDHGKLLTCLAGSVLDVVLDLRLGSPTYRKSFSLSLSAENKKILYIPPGLAHGFCVPGRDAALMSYLVSTEYSSEHDQGVRWDSFGFDWPVSDPILSQRDLGFLALERYESPFRWAEK